MSVAPVRSGSVSWTRRPSLVLRPDAGADGGLRGLGHASPSGGSFQLWHGDIRFLASPEGNLFGSLGGGPHPPYFHAAALKGDDGISVFGDQDFGYVVPGRTGGRSSELGQSVVYATNGTSRSALPIAARMGRRS